jgi:[NiFe] hydrogenase diaphorase moiety large subunit
MSDHIAAIAAHYDNDPTRLLDILLKVQAQERCVSDDAGRRIARELGLSWADIRQTASFYHFLSQTPRGTYTVYLNNSAVAEMTGCGPVASAFAEAVGCPFGSVSADGRIGLFYTADIGMNDQEVAALINGTVFTRLTPDKAKALVESMQRGVPVRDMVHEDEYSDDDGKGNGNNCGDHIRSMVRNNIRKTGPVYFSSYHSGAALQKAVTMSPEEMLAEVKDSKLRGRGGAGFPCGMKWEFCAKAEGTARCVVTNADEGEPGTFKDRVLLTERPHMIFEGMAVCAYAVGATTGILYLRGEYSYLKPHLEQVLDQMRSANLLGRDIAGRVGFDFDIRVQLGAGAYVCGEESALLESAEGKRGEPRNRPPFPAEKGYLGMPTVINNVETLAAAVQIIDKGAAWFRSIGTGESTGTKLLSISGDCDNPGVYEVAFGITIGEILTMAGARDPQAVQVGGPSGSCINASARDTVISFEACPTAGAIIIIGARRDLLAVIYNFMAFFTDESCGSCVPCRAGTWILRNTLRRIMEHQGIPEDLTALRQLGAVMQKANKCGLGQTAANPILTSMANFPQLYDALIPEQSDIRPFDLSAAVKASCACVGRTVGRTDPHEEERL